MSATDRTDRVCVVGAGSSGLAAALDRASARGRDKEFEWYVAALFRRAGLPVSLAEPDVLVQFRGGIRAIAAKRLASRKNADSNVKKAADQIWRAGYPGYIFLDITRYMDPDVQYIEHWTHDGHPGHPVEVRAQAFSKKPVISTARNTLVYGVFLRTAFPLISPGAVFGTAERWLAVGIEGGDKEDQIRLMHVLLSGARGT